MFCVRLTVRSSVQLCVNPVPLHSWWCDWWCDWCSDWCSPSSSSFSSRRESFLSLRSCFSISSLILWFSLLSADAQHPAITSPRTWPVRSPTILCCPTENRLLLLLLLLPSHTSQRTRKRMQIIFEMNSFFFPTRIPMKGWVEWRRGRGGDFKGLSDQSVVESLEKRTTFSGTRAAVGLKLEVTCWTLFRRLVGRGNTCKYKPG